MEKIRNDILNTVDIVDKIIENKIILILRGVPTERMSGVFGALREGGIKFIEVAYDSSARTTDDETDEKIRLLVSLAKQYDDMYIGAGTVLSPEQVDRAYKAGVSFIVSPDTNEDVIKRTKSLGLVSIPGGFTPTELQAAHRAGADFVKVFPASLGGPDYIKQLTAPLSHIRMLAVNGINHQTMQSYLRAGAVGVAVGGAIAPPDAVKDGDFDRIRRLAREFVDLVEEC